MTATIREGQEGTKAVGLLRPAVLGTFGLLGESPVALVVALIWFAHIGMDRLVGYGLKYPTEAGETHLGLL